MFKNLGEKLMRAAKEILLYGLFLSVLAAIICFFCEELGSGLLFLVAGPIGVLLAAVCLYWMGNVLVNQEEMIRRQKEIVWILRAQGNPGEEEKEEK